MKVNVKFIYTMMLSTEVEGELGMISFISHSRHVSEGR